ncbi:MAG TPA: glycosyltransferase family 39 protein [Candidatus Binatia bacterium]|nr:glycosyltransferase family 39 protein [Candidatus Binatia bacterium]
MVCLAILFANLGGAAFFEPDEGRNAEKAREILLLNDWVTPHHNFLPTLDKPMGFFWPVALSFTLFGFSEWAARLPSALAALGCLLLTYQFARRHWGIPEAVWSCLTLVTSVGFFIFARVVIFDMSLTFFVALALFSFYFSAGAEKPRQQSFHCFLMYAALGAGTLIKGAVALVLPGIVIFSYLLLTRRWSLVRRLRVGSGALLYLLIVLPWYVLSEMRNPGYLHYFILEEHLLRYTSAEFERSQPWYYFIAVAAVGFFPWIGLLPQAVHEAWRRRREGINQFLGFWAVLPVLFFSFSQSQLPQYILPVLPAFALITGRFLSERLTGVAPRPWRSLLIPWLSALTVMIYLITGAVWPGLAVRYIRSALAENLLLLVLCGAAVSLVFAVCVNGYKKDRWKGWEAVYLSTATGLALFFVALAQMTTPVSVERGSKSLARVAAPFIAPEDRVVFYDTYLPAIPFYLSADKPSWIVQKEGREEILGSNYLGQRRPDAVAGHGQVVFSFGEFAQLWQRSDLALRVIVKEKNLRRMSSNVGAAPKILTRFDEYLLVTNR